MLEGARDVCIAGVQEERDDWDAADKGADDCGKRLGFRARSSPYPVLLAGRSAYGDDGPALELSAWPTDNATSREFRRV